MSSDSVVTRMILVCNVAFLIFCASAVSAADISLEWNPSPSTNVAGYMLHYGVISGEYTSSQDAGTNTEITVSGFTPGQTYYFVVNAYGSNDNESTYSNKITNTVPPLLSSQ